MSRSMKEDTFTQNYQVLEELGSGSFGVVYKAIHRPSGEVVALKLIDLETSDDDIHEIQQEISLLSTCASPFVTQYRESFLHGHKLWIAMEFLGGGSCYELLKAGTFNEGQIAIICRELLLGLEYLHSEGKIHRDIKAANVLLASSGQVKLADFGVAAQLSNIKSERNTFVGTPFWMAPEVIEQSGYSFKADIWSLGITAIELFKGDPPNSDIHPMKVLFHIPKSPPPRLEGGSTSKEFKEFVAVCLNKDADARPSARTLLKHKFIRNAGKVQGLQELIERRQEFVAGQEKPHQPKLYAETMRKIPDRQEGDDWVFDTVVARSSTKRRRVSEKRKGSVEAIIAGLDDMDLDDENGPLPVPKIRHVSATLGTTRYVSGTVIKSPMRKVSSARKPRKPLVPTLNFGNSESSVRQFRRVSAERNVSGASGTTDISGSTMVQHDENKVPYLNSPSVLNSVLGCTAFDSAIEPAGYSYTLQRLAPDSRQAVDNVMDAWRVLDETNPEAGFNFLKLIIKKVKSNPTLAAALLPETRPRTPPKPKFVLAQNNPHLKSHRRRQSLQPTPNTPESSFGSEKSTMSDRMPGGEDFGMEHITQVSNFLYERWIDGLKVRCSGI